MSSAGKKDEAEITTFVQSDGYVTHYRSWGPSQGPDVVVLLHGGMSHSRWQAPLAEAVVSTSNISFVAPDRRGAGLNTVERGHMLSLDQVVDDVVSLVRFLRRSFAHVHLAGWCFGGQVATIAASRLANEGVISSLLLVAPAFFWDSRYSEVLKRSIRSVLEVVEEFNLRPSTTRAFIPLPLEPSDFTIVPEWQRFIGEDQLRLTKVTRNTVAVSYEIQEQSRKSLSQVRGIPVLAVFGKQDTLIDNDRVLDLLLQQLTNPAPEIEVLEARHGVHFDQPRKLAEIVTGFLSRVSRVPSAREQLRRTWEVA